MPKHGIEVLEFLPFQRSTLLGFAKVRIRELRLVISGIGGALIHEPDGRIKYAKVLEFETAEVRQAFSTAVLEAYDRFRPP